MVDFCSSWNIHAWFTRLSCCFQTVYKMKWPKDVSPVSDPSLCSKCNRFPDHTFNCWGWHFMFGFEHCPELKILRLWELGSRQHQCFPVGDVDLWRTWRHWQRQCTVPHINYVDNVNFDGTQVSALYTNIGFSRRINKRCIGYHVWSVSLCKQSCSLRCYGNAGECFVLLYWWVPSLLQVAALLLSFHSRFWFACAQESKGIVDT